MKMKNRIKYIQPQIKCVELDNETIMAASPITQDTSEATTPSGPIEAGGKETDMPLKPWEAFED